VQDNPNKDWHLDRRLQITHILSTLAMGVGAIMYVGDIRKDVEVLKSQRVDQALQDQRQDATMLEVKRETLNQLDKIDQKLDRLIEKRMAR
jgi:hypothetical protein